MNHPDEAIDKALESIAHAPVPNGMEARILRRLAAQPTAQPTHPIGTKWLLPASAICLACLVLAVLDLTHPRDPNPHRTPAVSPPSSPTTRPPAPILMPVTAKPHLRHLGRSATQLQKSGLPLPAPAAPLTKQEKLLLKFAHARQAEITGLTQSAGNQPHASPTPAGTHAPLTHEETLLVAVSRVRQNCILDALDERHRANADAQEKQDFAAYATQKDGGS